MLSEQSLGMLNHGGALSKKGAFKLLGSTVGVENHRTISPYGGAIFLALFYPFEIASLNSRPKTRVLPS